MNPFPPERVAEADIMLRQPDRGDGAALYELVAACPPLDLNSRYAYLLLCRHHAETCVIAQCDGAVVGAITAYLPPEQPDTLFVWQVAVASRMRGQKLGTHMLDCLLRRCIEPRQLRWVETSINPSNYASQRLFTQFARRHGTGFTTSTLFSASDFGAPCHEAEWLYQIGPWNDQSACPRRAVYLQGLSYAHI
jgi:L-2,4-diaminobutyric acid acetyltransferase